VKHEGFHGRAGFGQRPALLVIDVNVGFTDPASPLVCDLEDVVAAIRRLLDEFRRAELPVVYTTVSYDEGDKVARETADSLAAALGASVIEFSGHPVDLLVVGSRPESPPGKVTLSASSDYAVEAATYPVLVVPRGVAISFSAAQAQPV